MNMISLDVKDGHGLISVVVEDMADAERLRRMVKNGLDAIVVLNEMEEKEMEVTA